MIGVPFSFLSYCDENPASGRWDQAWVTRILNGEEWLVPSGFRFVEEPWDAASNHGRVIVFPAGHYAEHCGIEEAADRLLADLERLAWAVLIATSDECAHFPWHKINLPEHVRLWVMLPRPENEYPDGTFFIGEGSPTSAREIASLAADERDLDVFFSGQMGHDRREEMWKAVAHLQAHPNCHIARTAGFTQGMSREDYLTTMTRSWIVLCPSGICSQSSFRAFETLEAGSIPIVDGLRPDGEGEGYWQMVWRFIDPILDWNNINEWLSDILLYDDRHLAAARCSSEWQQYKRRVARRLDDDIWRAAWDWSNGGYGGGPGGADDEITVIIPTSPSPHHPRMDMIVETVISVRERLPRAEILITCDGVRDEQKHLAADYYVYLHRLAMWCNVQQNVCPIIMPNHRHQSGMMHEALGQVRTPYVMYVEHDTPLEGPIDFGDCIQMMGEHELALLRFSHEAHMLPQHRHLFLEADPGDAPYVRTIQWSQRPHLARADWYRDIMATYFGTRSRTMIEDVMHGVVQHEYLPRKGLDGQLGPGKRLMETWQKWRLAVYAPEGTWKRSSHLDGRAGEPKYTMVIDYDRSEVPPGAPQPGVM